MSRDNRFPIYLFVIVLIFFAIGLYNLFSIRFRIGDIYPAYSSLRSDPLGTKIFFKGLEGLGDIDVERNLQPLSKFTGDRYTTLFVLGLDVNWMETTDMNTYRAFSGLAASGGRLVISLYPSEKVSGSEASTEAKDQEADKDNEEGGDKEHVKGSVKNKKIPDSLLERWGLSITSSKLQALITADLKKGPEDADLPLSIKCASNLYFNDLDDGWNVIYAKKGLPVMIERRFGSGIIILCADSFLFSNEAMMSERYPRMLAWLAGRADKIYFDESHFGISKNSGITDLMHKYGLQGVFLALLLIAGLFLWKTSTHFVPPINGWITKKTSVRTERDHLDGLVGLLQRNIPQKDLLNICVMEWERSIAGAIRSNPAIISKVRELISGPDTHRDPVQSYNKICVKILERKRL